MSSIIVGLTAASNVGEPEPFDVDISTISYDNTGVAPVQCILPPGSNQINNNSVFGGEPFVYNIKNSRDGLGITVGQGTNACYVNWELLFGGGPWMPGNTELFETAYLDEPSSFRSAQGGWSWIDSNTALLYQDNAFEHALHKYTVSTPYDISTRANAPTQVFSANNTHWHKQAKSFFGDEYNGTFVVLVDDNGLFRYDLTEAWNVATMSSEPDQYYAFGNVLPDTNRVRELSAVFMNKAGDKLFYTDSISDQDIHMKELSTPWDLTTLVGSSTTTYTQANYGLITSDSTAPSPQGNSYCAGILWNETIQGDHTVNVANSTFLAIGANSYFDHSTATATTGGLQKFLRWKFDGRTAICSAADNKKVIALKLSQPWVISSATYDNANLSSDFSSVVGLSATFVRDFHIKEDGKRAWVLFDTPERIYQLDFTTPWDLSTAQYNSVSFLVDGTVLTGSMDMYSMAVNEDGTRIIMTDEVPTLGSGTPKFWQINVTTPWDLSTASYSGNSLTVNPGQGWSQEDKPAVYISPRGDFMVTIGTTIDHMHQWTMSTPGDISTATYDYTYTDVSNENGNPRGVSFSTDGTFFYIMNNENTAGNTKINQYHTGGQHASLGVTTWEGRGAFGHPAGKYCALVNGWTQQNMMRIGTTEKPSHSQGGQVLERVYTYDNMDWPSYVSGGQVAQVKGINNAGFSNDNAPNYYISSYKWWIGTYPGEDGYNSTSGGPEYIVNVPEQSPYGSQMALHSWRMTSPGDIRSMDNGHSRRVKSTDTSGTYGVGGRGIDFTRSGYLLHVKESGSGSTQTITLDYSSVNGPESTFDFGTHTSRDLITWFRDTTDFTDTNYDATNRTIYDLGLKLRKEPLFDFNLSSQQRLWFLTKMTGTSSQSTTWGGYVMRCATATSSNVNTTISTWNFNTGANYFWEIPQGTPGSGIDSISEAIYGWDVSSDGTIILIMTGLKLYKFKATSGWNLSNSNITFDQAVDLPLKGQVLPRGCWLNHDGNKLYVVDANGFFYQYSFS